MPELSFALISARFVLRELISSLRLDKSATICWRREELASSKVTVLAGAAAATPELSVTGCSGAGAASDLISFTIGAEDMLSLSTERS